ncbi:MAG: hypothetical protein H8D97_01860 [Proteobacteria bacterium]|nr:hypothetical protein [Pseudomonadota bacterium]
MITQNWNHVISYIRSQIGSINQLEISDDELIEYLRNHTLPEFSIFSPAKLWVLLSDSDRVIVNPLDPALQDTTYDEDTYTIPLPEDVEIINVENAYFRRGISGGDNAFGKYSHIYQTDPRDTVMNNTFSTMMDYLKTVQYYEYLPPKTIVFGHQINSNGLILELHVYHVKLSTIKRDIYTNLFRKMAVYDIINMIIANRSKFQQVSSPFGEIQLNIEFLEKKAEKFEQQIEEYKQWMPPAKLASWIE